MAHIVVLEALPQDGPGALWAWCRVGDGPGFEAIDYTTPDGMPCDAPDEATLGRVLFTLPAPDGEPVARRLTYVEEFAADEEMGAVVSDALSIFKHYPGAAEVDVRDVGRWWRRRRVMSVAVDIDVRP